MAKNETLDTFGKIYLILISFMLAIAVIYLLLLLLWVVPAIGLLINSCKRLRSLSALRGRDIDEHAVHMKVLYKERTVRYTLFVCYLITEIIALLFLPVRPLKDLAVLSNSNITHLIYFNDPPLTDAVYFLSCFIACMYCLLFGVTILHLRLSINIENYGIKKLFYQSGLELVSAVSSAIICSVANYFNLVINLLCVAILGQLFILYLMRQVKRFLRELEWQREDALSYHTKHSNIIKEKNWLIKHYRRVLWWTVLAFQSYMGYLILDFVAKIVKLLLMDISEIPYRSILALSSIIMLIGLLLMITLNLYVLSVVYTKNRRGRKWRYNYRNCGLREPLLN